MITVAEYGANPAVKDCGATGVRLAAGTWGFEFLRGADRFFPITYKDAWKVVREIANASGTAYNKETFEVEAKREAEDRANDLAESLPESWRESLLEIWENSLPQNCEKSLPESRGRSLQESWEKSLPKSGERI